MAEVAGVVTGGTVADARAAGGPAVVPLPLIDVVIPAYNRERIISRALASVLEQEGVQVRVWVVDDASTDGTADVVAAIAAGDERVRLLRHESNAGVSAARNTGIAAVRSHQPGEFLALLDSDDRYPAGALRLLADALRARPEAPFAQGSRLDIPEDVVLNGTEDEQRSAGTLVSDLFVSGVLVRVSTFDHVGVFDPSLRTDEDLPWFAAITDAGMVGVRPSVVTLLRTKGRDSLSLGADQRRQARLAWVRDRLNAAR